MSANLGTALRPLLERSSDAALILTTEGIVTYASPAVEALFGWQPQDLVGKSLTGFVDPRDHEDLYRVLHESGQRFGQTTELRLAAAPGSVTAEAAFTDLRDDPVVRGVVCNLRHSERLARTRERERISQSAHADILQTLFGATLDLSAAQTTTSPAECERLEAALSKVELAIAALRRLLAPDDERRSSARPPAAD
ncbi:MAG TPA: PAS domain-containing protein [Jatrophihabitans sp.]|nr:PAS domain-containing protein [Jatrophihabitans sp.]